MRKPLLRKPRAAPALPPLRRAAESGDPRAAFDAFTQAYVTQRYEVPAGRRAPTPDHVSERFAQSLRGFFGDQVDAVPFGNLDDDLARDRLVERASGEPLSVDAVQSRLTESYYWAAIVISNTLGTALGDYMAKESSEGGLGLEVGGGDGRLLEPALALAEGRIAADAPLYVVKLEHRTSRVIVGDRKSVV